MIMHIVLHIDLRQCSFCLFYSFMLL